MKKYLFKNAKLVLHNRLSENGSLLISGDKIIALGSEELELGLEEHIKTCKSGFMVINLSGDILIPGLIDTHVHGTGGFDSMDMESQSLKRLSQALLKEGTTAYLATTMSCPQEKLFRVLENIRLEINEQICQDKTQLQEQKESLESNRYGSEILGVHLEGPFLATCYKGAQPRESIFPSDNDAMPVLTELATRFPRLIRILTLAVERPDAQNIIEHCLDQDIIPSVGHSGASYEEMERALCWGLRHVTHAFNAMPTIHHRQPGLLTLALTDPRVMIELIADGVHIHPGVLKIALQLKPDDKICLVSDGTRAVGFPEGHYELGGQIISLKQGSARLDDGTLAGSAQSLLQGVRTLVNFLKWPIHKAVRCASLNPAQLLRIDGRLGSLEPGKEATFLRLSPDLLLKEVWMKGRRNKI